jgi:hypothetical protein
MRVSSETGEFAGEVRRVHREDRIREERVHVSAEQEQRMRPLPLKQWDEGIACAAVAMVACILLAQRLDSEGDPRNRSGVE